MDERDFAGDKKPESGVRPNSCAAADIEFRLVLFIYSAYKACIEFFDDRGEEKNCSAVGMPGKLQVDVGSCFSEAGRIMVQKYFKSLIRNDFQRRRGLAPVRDKYS